MGCSGGGASRALVLEEVNLTPLVDPVSWHGATGNQWKAASAQNRLATAADFVAKVAKPSSMDDLREKAQELQICISEAVADPSGDGQEVSGIAAACVILMGYVR